MSSALAKCCNHAKAQAAEPVGRGPVRRLVAGPETSYMGTLPDQRRISWLSQCAKGRSPALYGGAGPSRRIPRTLSIVAPSAGDSVTHQVAPAAL